ncbi:SusC/RagA family TonB-linked outer membrane protein [Pontibacter harenae]|uniref:SusC/RagA family TonB-linked outer membrane protein n=1 Tax=Pontibacter harenae TaxID=2894083 RepID=UPI001E365C55|nr:TonB-dependent receptor [Pontibacter harenae]MCC9168583.1 TonB-dependent receptor [Pontibacter harenae]
MTRLLLLSFALLFTLTHEVAAQHKSVSGTVTDRATGEGLPGVSVVVKGTAVGTATGVDGTYTISVPADGQTLEFRFIGYQAVERAIGNASTIDVALGVDQKLLEEVVVVAYGTADKSSFTGSASQIGSEEFELRPVTNITNAIAGKAAGVQTTSGSGQPGEGPTIRIRGVGSINGNNDPLYVVDGVPYSGSIANLNVDDIENMSILKDAASASMYGARAANGVVIITTKKGKKGRNQLNVKLSQGVSERAIPEYDRLNAYEYYPLMWEAYRNSLAYRASNPLSLDQANQRASEGIKGLLGYNPFNVPDNQIVFPDGTINPDAQLLYPDDLDWEAPITRAGSRADYNISYSGGSEKSDYYVSLGYLNDKGFAIRTDYERVTGRVNVNTQPLNWFKGGLNIAGTVTNSNQVATTGSTTFVNPFFLSRTMGPIYPVYAHDPLTGEYILDENGQRIYDLGSMSDLGLPTRANSPGRHIIAETNLNDYGFNRNVLSARTYGEIYFLKDFKFTTNLSVDITNNNNKTYQNTLVGDGAPAGRASRTSTNTTSYNFNQLLNYSKTFGLHTVDALLGHENYDWTYDYFTGSRQGIISEGNSELINFTTTNNIESRQDLYRTEGYFSRVNYSFDDKYSLSASYRRDGTSRFYSDVRWGDFWSLGAAWRLDQESFINLPDWVNMLKVRGSYGEVGNDDVGDYYAWQALYELGYNNASEPGYLQSTLGNRELVWESNNSFDVGIDFDLFDRARGSVEFFNRQSENLLFEVPLPISSGIMTRFENVGAMYNRGVEFQVSADVIRGTDFNWNIDLNWTTYKNQITKLPQDEIIDGTKKLMADQSIYDFWLRDWYGVDPATGAALYRADTYNESNSMIIGSDTVTTNINNARYQYSGSAIPNFAGGITNTFSYKNFSLSALLTYQVGGKVYDAAYASLMSAGSYGTALHVDALGRWQNPGDVTDVPRMDNSQTTNFNASNSDRWLVDASYLNFRSVNLSYSLPASVASKLQMQNALIYITGENLALISARKGLNVTQAFSGVTSNYYSAARVLTLGLNVTL